MDQEWSARHYAVMMGAADTFIIWRLIRNARAAGLENGWWLNAWKVCDAPVSNARPSWSQTTIPAAASFGSVAAGEKLLAQQRWESIYDRQLTNNRSLLLTHCCFYAPP